MVEVLIPALYLKVRNVHQKDHQTNRKSPRQLCSGEEVKNNPEKPHLVTSGSSNLDQVENESKENNFFRKQAHTCSRMIKQLTFKFHKIFPVEIVE